MKGNSAINPNLPKTKITISDFLNSSNNNTAKTSSQPIKQAQNPPKIIIKLKEQVNNNAANSVPKNKTPEILNELNYYKKTNFKNLYNKSQFCDFYKDQKWQIAEIIQIINDDIIIKEAHTLQKYKFNLFDTKVISYFRKYTNCSSTNFYNQNINYEELKKKLYSLTQKKEAIFNVEENPFNIYYFLNSEVYFGLDMAMKSGYKKSIDEVEADLDIILTVLGIICNFFKYLKNDFQNFLYYEKNIKNNKELCDLVVLNKNYAIFSFFPSAQNILNKIFFNEKNYFRWYVENENYLKKIIFSENNKNSKFLKYPKYADQLNPAIKNIAKLTKICIDKAYEPQVTFTSLDVQAKANILAYFTDYFHYIGGFKIIINILCNSQCSTFELIYNFIDLLYLAKSLTNFYAKEYQNEKQQLKKFIYNFIDNLDKESIEKYNRNDILNLIKKVVNLSTLQDNRKNQKSENNTDEIIYENLYLNYIFKNLLLTDKLNQKITAINTINNILKSIEYNKLQKNNLINDDILKYKDRDTEISKMTYYDFCICCKEKNIIQLLLNEKSVHEEIIKRLSQIIFIMYKNKFGYKNKGDENQIESDKELIYKALFTKLLDSDQNNKNISKQIQETICNFTNILSENDKSILYSKIKNYFKESIKNKGLPTKELFYFIINFSIRAINNSNFSNNNNIIDKNEEKDIEKKEKIDKFFGIGKKKTEETSNKVSFVNYKFDENVYYGLQLLTDYLLEESYTNYNMTKEQKSEIINICIEGIIKIFELSKMNKTLFEKILLKMTIEKNSSNNIVQYLLLLQKLIKHPKNTLSENFKKIFEEFSINYKFFNILIDDMQRYMSYFDEKRDGSQNEKEIVYEGVYNNEINIELRLEFIFMLLFKEKKKSNIELFNSFFTCVCFSDNYLKICFFKHLIENINKFDNETIKFLYDIIISVDSIYQIKDEQSYILYKETIKIVNKMKKNFYYMNNNDLAVISCQSEKQIIGIDKLWELLINTENKKILEDLENFLCDICLSIRMKKIEDYEAFWREFFSIINSKLDLVMKDNKNEKAIKGIISLIKKIMEKTNNKGEVIRNLNNILQECNFNNKNITKSGNENIAKEFLFIGSNNETKTICKYDIKITNKEFFYILRYKLSNFFKIPVNLVKVIVEINENNIKTNKQDIDYLKSIELTLFNDFQIPYQIFDNIDKMKKKYEKLNINIKVVSLNNHPFIDKINQNPKNIMNILPSLSIKLMNLLKQTNGVYIMDVWLLVKDDIQKEKTGINDAIKNLLLNNNTYSQTNGEVQESDPENLFNFENISIFYKSYVLSHLVSVLDSFKSDKEFIQKNFIKSKIWNEKVKNIKIENDNVTSLDEILEKYNLISSLIYLYKLNLNNLIEEDCNTNLFILQKLVNFYYIIVNDRIKINLKLLPKSNGINIDKVEEMNDRNLNAIKKMLEYKNIFNELIKVFILAEKNINLIDNSYIEIKKELEFIFIEGVLKSKGAEINDKIKLILLGFTNEENFIKLNKNNDISIKDLYLYFVNLFFSENAFNRVFRCLKEISNKKNNLMFEYLNIEKYENNLKFFFEIIINLLENIYPKIAQVCDFNTIINEIILPKIFSPLIKDLDKDSNFHEIVFGGCCQILNKFIFLNNKYKNDENKKLLSILKEKNLGEFLFSEVILYNCKENILSLENLDKNNCNINYTSSYTFRESVDLFISLLMEKLKENNFQIVDYYLNKLNEFHKNCYWKSNNMLDWKLSFDEDKKITPFVGLKNLGCTCYMNSILQVFFNILPFRESLLKCECKEENKNSLYQLKKVFYFLKYLNVNYYTPTSFPDNFDDEILNVHLQMDVDEFFGNILDKIENRLKGTMNENLVKYFFQGRQNDNLTFQNGCTHHRTNTNSFYSVQLQIKNKKNLYESLDSLIEGELMNGDNCIFCPKCNFKLPVVKNQIFKTLPRILLFVLKRFEFNYDTMQKTKINDRYEFPLELDMLKYTDDYKKNKNCDNNEKYKLKSIVIHKGSSEGGHYYAIIKENKSGLWYEFNDTKISRFDIRRLEEETFGGYFQDEKNNKVEINNNAYLLFYEKIDQSDCENFDKIDSVNTFLTKNYNDNIINGDRKNEENENIDNKNYNYSDNDKNKVKEISGMENILKCINSEMYKYFLNKKLFSGDYQYFILELYINILNYYYSKELDGFFRHLCHNANENFIQEIFIKDRGINAKSSNLYIYFNSKRIQKNENEMETKLNNEEIQKILLNLFQYLIIYFFHVLIRTKDHEFLFETVDLIKFFLNQNSECADFLIEEFCQYNVIVEYIINCPRYEIKKLIVGIIYCAMIKSIESQEIKLKQNEINNKKYKNNKENLDLIKYQNLSDEEFARRLQKEEFSKIKNNNYHQQKINENPLDQKHIPMNLLKLIYNILAIIRETKYSMMNEQRFLYLLLYRFSTISKKTRKFLVTKCPVLELLCLILHQNLANEQHNINSLIETTYKGYFTVSHGILNTFKERLNIIQDKNGLYRIENYVYVLYFYLLSYTQKENCKNPYRLDIGYSFDNERFIKVLFNNIRTKQDVFGFSNLINIKCKNSTSRMNSFIKVFGEILDNIDWNENINYDRNNYINFVNNSMNENPTENDPGINPKYLLIIIKRFITKVNNNNLDDYRIKNTLKLIFKIFNNYSKYYSFSLMIIDFIIDLFTYYPVLFTYKNIFANEFGKMVNWLSRNKIAPILYEISGITMYKNCNINYEQNISQERKKIFEEKEKKKTENRISQILNLQTSNDIKEYIPDLDLTDFKFITGDVVDFEGKNAVVVKFLDELLDLQVISCSIKDNKVINEKKRVLVETDNPRIRIIRLNENGYK